ncbi:MAG: Uma2 family endonuclease [Pirellulaceae bacterium]|nr:Uma2 family endonuclease [Pirellulaceae bacterium]
MSTVIADRLYTPHDLLTMPEGKHYELVDGRLVEEEMSLLACGVVANLIRILGNYVLENGLGGVFSSEVGFQCFPQQPGKIRKPDASFIRRERLSEEIMTGHVPIPPDLAVEVISPTDIYYEVEEKVDEYLHAGVALVWVLNPKLRTVRVFRPDGTVAQLGETSVLAGEGVVPGFSCKVADLFALSLKAS